MKKKKYSTGGQILSTMAGFIPGYGQILSPLVLAADAYINKPKEEKPAQSQAMNQNPLGYAEGGFIGDNFKQYNTGSHKSKKDLTVNKNGLPDMNGEDAVQNKENMVMIKGKPFVMSDTLINPETGNTFNVDATKVIKKRKNARFQPEVKNTLDMEMGNLAGLNNALKQLTEVSKNFAKGGFIEPPKTGTIFDNQYQMGTEERYDTFNENLPYQDHLFNEPIPKVMSNDPQLESIETNYGTELPLGSNLSNSNVASTERSIKPPSIGTNNLANTLGLALKGVALGRSAYDAFSGSTKEDLLLPNYSKSDKYMREANIDYSQAKQSALGASNLNSNLNRSSSSGFAQFSGRQNANFGTLADNLSTIDMNQNNAQSQLSLSKGQYEQQKAVDTSNRQYQNQQNNLMNDANQRNFKRDFFSDLSQIGSELNSYGETQKVIKNNQEINTFRNNQYLSFLNAKYPNLSVNPDILEKFKTNQLTLDEMFSYLPANVVSDLKQNVKQ